MVMQTDNRVQYTSLSASYACQACVQCKEMLPPRRTNPASVCDRCQSRVKSSAKRQKTSHSHGDSSVAITSAIPSTFRSMALKADVKSRGWKADTAQPRASFTNSAYHLPRVSRPPTRSFSDPSPSYRHMTQTAPHAPSKQSIRLPEAVLLSQYSYAFMPAQTAAPHFNSRGEFIPVPPLTHSLVPRNSSYEAVPCDCRMLLRPGHAWKHCASCHAALFPQSRQSTPTTQLPFLGPSQVRKHPVVDHDMPSPPLRIPVGAEESRCDSASTHALSSIPNSPKQWIMPMLDVDFPVISPVSESFKDTATDSDIDINIAVLAYPDPAETSPSDSLPPQQQKLTEIQQASIESQVVGPEIQDHASSNKPMLSIYIPPRETPNHQETRSSPRSSVPNQTSMNSSGHTCSTQGCDSHLAPNATSSHCFSCIVKTWRIRCTKSGTLPDRSVTKNRKKSVAWADEVGGDLECLDKRLEYGQSPNCVLPSPPSSESLDTHKMDIEEDVVMKSPSDSASLSRGKHLPPRLTQSAELFSVGEGKPLASSPSESNLPLPRRFSSPCTDSCSDVSSSTGDRAMDGWNSDVGEFSDPSVNDDSESDSSSGPDGSESDSSSGSDGPESDSSSGSDSPKPIPQPTGLKIRIPARPRPPDDGVPRCTIKHCQAVLPPDYRWKCCVSCRTQYRRYQRSRLGIQGKRDEDYFSSKVRDYIPRSTTHLPSPPLTPRSDETLSKHVPGARVCSVRNCAHIIPPLSEYRWKLCEPCRIRMRHKNQRRQARVAPSADAEHKPDSAFPYIREEDQGSGNESEDIPLAVVLKQKMLTKHHSGRCSSSDCGMLLDPKLSRLECTQCAYRKLGVGRSKQERQRDIQTPVKPAPSPYPRYQCLSALLSALKSRFIDFLDAHSLYYLSKLTQGAGQPDNAVVFGFNGEFSVVALDFDILGRREEIGKNAVKLKEGIEDLCGFKFSESCISTHAGGLVRRFTCLHDIPSPAPTPVTPSSDFQTCAKTMQGELEVSVFADRSHRLFAGRRTIVRFCLVG